MRITITGRNLDLTDGLKEAVAEIERQIIEQVLEQCGNDQTAAAERLKIGKTTLWPKLKGADESGDN